MTSNLWHEYKGEEDSGGNHHPPREQDLVEYQPAAEGKGDDAQNDHDGGAGVDDDDHLFGVVEDLDLDLPCDDGQDEGHHLQGEEVDILNAYPHQARAEAKAYVDAVM